MHLMKKKEKEKKTASKQCHSHRLHALNEEIKKTLFNNMIKFVIKKVIFSL